MTTPLPVSEQALHRVLRYLQMAGVPITSEVEKRALALVAQALESDPANPLPTCMAQLAQSFTLPGQVPPRLAPPLNRGSLGYGDY